MEKKIVSVKDVVKMVATATGESQRVVRNVLDALSQVASNELTETTEGLSVEVKVCPGVSLKSDYVDSRIARNPRTGEIITAAPKIRVKGHIMKSFKDAVNGVGSESDD